MGRYPVFLAQKSAAKRGVIHIRILTMLKNIVVFLLVALIGLSYYAFFVKPKQVEIIKHVEIEVPRSYGFDSDEQRIEVLTYTESEFEQLLELGLAQIEHDEKRRDTVTKRNKLGIKVTAIMELKWKSRYKFGLNLNQGWDAKFVDNTLYVNVPKVELLSAELIGRLEGEVLDKGWGIDEDERLKALTESAPEIVRERGQGMVNNKEIEALVSLGVEKHIRKIFKIKGIEVAEIRVTYGSGV